MLIAHHEPGWGNASKIQRHYLLFVSIVVLWYYLLDLSTKITQYSVCVCRYRCMRSVGGVVGDALNLVAAQKKVHTKFTLLHHLSSASNFFFCCPLMFSLSPAHSNPILSLYSNTPNHKYKTLLVFPMNTLYIVIIFFKVLISVSASKIHYC